MLIGYARVSTSDQSPLLQTDALKQAGCQKIFSDTISGKNASRPQLDKLKEHCRQGDTVVVWRLDRLGRSLKDLIEIINFFDSHGISFKSLHENIDTATSSGKLIFHIFGALAEFERNLIVDRTKAGLEAAKRFWQCIILKITPSKKFVKHSISLNQHFINISGSKKLNISFFDGIK